MSVIRKRLWRSLCKFELFPVLVNTEWPRMSSDSETGFEVLMAGLVLKILLNLLREDISDLPYSAKLNIQSCWFGILD